MNKTRQDNLRLLRHSIFNTGQESFAETLNLGQSTYSRLERGEDAIDDSLARRIEAAYSLPSGWMDRDNPNLFLSSDEFKLIINLRRLPEDNRKTVVVAVSKIVEIAADNH